MRLSANWMAACGVDGEDAALYEAVRAVGEEFCPQLGLAIPVGKDSLSMRTAWQQEGVEQVGDRAGVADRVGVRAGAGRAAHLDAGAATGSRRHTLLLIDLGARTQPARHERAGAGVQPHGRRAGRRR